MKKKLEFGTVELAEDGVLKFVASSHMKTVSLGQLEALLEVLVEMADGKPRPFYSDNGNMDRLGHKERKFIGSNLHLFAKASAVKETSIMIRSIGYAINHLFPPKVPMQMFKSEEEAMEWLKSLE